MSVSDLNSFYGNGGNRYEVIFLTSTPQNLPSDISGANRIFLEIIHSSGGYDVIQRITNRGSNITYQRYGTGVSSGSGTWSAWKAMTN